MGTKKNFRLTVAVNAEGHKLAYLSDADDDGGYRIAGPKAWGGSRTLAKLTIEHDDLVRFIRDYAPSVLEELLGPELTALRSQVAELRQSLQTADEMNAICENRLDELRAKNAELQRQLDEAAGQEPVAFMDKYGFFADFEDKDFNIPLYRLPPNLPALIEQAKAEEREACAKVCEAIAKRYVGFGFVKVILDCADAIRARKP